MGKEHNFTNMVDAANEAEQENEVVDFAEAKKEAEDKPKRKPFVIWEVDGKQYKLKLDVTKILELEAKYKTNLINIMGSGDEGMPALAVMLDITHAALTKYHHGITKSVVNELFTKYMADGGSQLEFYMSTYMEIFAVSGFFSDNMTEKMTEAMNEAKTDTL